MYWFVCSTNASVFAVVKFSHLIYQQIGDNFCCNMLHVQVGQEKNRAHRLVRVAEEDWGLQACKTGVRPDRIWINTVGTFGIGSAAYYWSRLMAGIGRAAFYMLGQSESSCSC